MEEKISTYQDATKKIEAVMREHTDLCAFMIRSANTIYDNGRRVDDQMRLERRAQAKIRLGELEIEKRHLVDEAKRLKPRRMINFAFDGADVDATDSTQLLKALTGILLKLKLDDVAFTASELSAVHASQAWLLNHA